GSGTSAGSRSPTSRSTVTPPQASPPPRLTCAHRSVNNASSTTARAADIPWNGSGMAQVVTSATLDRTGPAPALDLSVVIVSWNTRDLLLGCLRALGAALGDLRC